MTGIVTAIYLLMRKPKYLLLYALPVMVGISRIMLGVHTETDVVAGFMLGLSITLVVWGFRKDFYRWKD
jgi:membrane-associated phospholipid phosphatase